MQKRKRLRGLIAIILGVISLVFFEFYIKENYSTNVFQSIFVLFCFISLVYYSLKQFRYTDKKNNSKK